VRLAIVFFFFFRFSQTDILYRIHLRRNLGPMD
jgi:hypothetical protein